MIQRCSKSEEETVMRCRPNSCSLFITNKPSLLNSIVTRRPMAQRPRPLVGGPFQPYILELLARNESPSRSVHPVYPQGAGAEKFPKRVAFRTIRVHVVMKGDGRK